MGSNTENFMKNLSKAAALQKEYANHCIRTTCIYLLDQYGFQGRHIKTISGHKSEELLTSYCYDTSGTKVFCITFNLLPKLVSTNMIHPILFFFYK